MIIHILGTSIPLALMLGGYMMVTYDRSQPPSSEHLIASVEKLDRMGPCGQAAIADLVDHDRWKPVSKATLNSMMVHAENCDVVMEQQWVLQRKQQRDRLVDAASREDADTAFFREYQKLSEQEKSELRDFIDARRAR